MLVITSDMFSYVNIHSQALAKVDPTAVGSALAWQASDWSFPATVPSPLKPLAKTEVLGKDSRQWVVIPATMNFADAVQTCTNLGMLLSCNLRYSILKFINTSVQSFCCKSLITFDESNC
jgi:hypothetical protein